MISDLRTEIERRWQEAPTYLVGSIGPMTYQRLYWELRGRPGYPADLEPPTTQGRDWLSTHLHAQEDVQILLEGIATLTREVRAAHDLYQEPLRLAAEANVNLRQERDDLFEQLEKERKDHTVAKARISTLECVLAELSETAVSLAESGRLLIRGAVKKAKEEAGQ